MENYVRPFSLFSEQDIYLFKEGSHFQLYNLLGAHPVNYEGKDGVYFAVWAPNAKHVSVIGDFNYWDKYSHPLNPRGDSSGIWEGFIPYLKQGDTLAAAAGLWLSLYPVTIPAGMPTVYVFPCSRPVTLTVTSVA